MLTTVLLSSSHTSPPRHATTSSRRSRRSDRDDTFRGTGTIPLRPDSGDSKGRGSLASLTSAIAGYEGELATVTVAAPSRAHLLRAPVARVHAPARLAR